MTMRLTKQQFIDRFEPSEFTGLLAAAKASTDIEAWLFRFNNLTPDADGTSVDLADPRTVRGVHGLEAAGLIGAGRAEQILRSAEPGSDLDELDGIRRGDRVRVLPPFDASFPGPRVVEAIAQTFDGATYRITGGWELARDQLEVI